MIKEITPLDELLDCLKLVPHPLAGELILHLDKAKHVHGLIEHEKEQEIQEKLMILRRFGTPVMSYVAWAQEYSRQQQQDFVLWFEYLHDIINGKVLPSYPIKTLLMVAIDEMVRLHLQSTGVSKNYDAYLHYLNGITPKA